MESSGKSSRYAWTGKHFPFLTDTFGFAGPFSFQWATEDYWQFVKGRIVVSIGYSGAYWVNIYEIKNETLAGKIQNTGVNPRDLTAKDCSVYNLSELDLGKSLPNIHRERDSGERTLAIYSAIILRNPEILGGDFNVFKNNGIIGKFAIIIRKAMGIIWQ